MKHLIVTCLYLMLNLASRHVIAVSVHFGKCNVDGIGVGYCRPLHDCQSLIALSDDEITQYRCGARRDLYCCISEPQQQQDGNRIAEVDDDNTLPQAPICGRMFAERIHGGVNTSRTEFPWTALVEYTRNDLTKGHFCGATLISNRWVITAAHCVTGRHVPRGTRVTGVRLGEWNTAENPDCEYDIRGIKECSPDHIDVSVDQIITHADFDRPPYKYSNDIALLHLSRSIEFSQYVKPICLPLQTKLRDDRLTESEVEVAGWGRTEHNDTSSPIKLKALLNVWQLSECQKAYQQYKFALDDRQMCAGGGHGVDTCKGDSGGPLMIETYDEETHNRFYYLAGIVSFGKTKCGQNGFPGVYARVGAYIDWIQENIKSQPVEVLSRYIIPRR